MSKKNIFLTFITVFAPYGIPLCPFIFQFQILIFLGLFLWHMFVNFKTFFVLFIVYFILIL